VFHLDGYYKEETSIGWRNNFQTAIIALRERSRKGQFICRKLQNSLVSNWFQACGIMADMSGGAGGAKTGGGVRGGGEGGG